ncbi:MAG: hypothetical protein ACJA08_000267 [Cyclobacteriaceae bacterium]|jgi:hypothetical protein
MKFKTRAFGSGFFVGEIIAVFGKDFAFLAVVSVRTYNLCHYSRKL